MYIAEDPFYVTHSENEHLIKTICQTRSIFKCGLVGRNELIIPRMLDMSTNQKMKLSFYCYKFINRQCLACIQLG